MSRKIEINIRLLRLALSASTAPRTKSPWQTVFPPQTNLVELTGKGPEKTMDNRGFGRLVKFSIVREAGSSEFFLRQHRTTPGQRAFPKSQTPTKQPVLTHRRGEVMPGNSCPWRFAIRDVRLLYSTSPVSFAAPESPQNTHFRRLFKRTEACQRADAGVFKNASMASMPRTRESMDAAKLRRT